MADSLLAEHFFLKSNGNHLVWYGNNLVRNGSALRQPEPENLWMFRSDSGCLQSNLNIQIHLFVWLYKKLQGRTESEPLPDLHLFSLTWIIFISFIPSGNITFQTNTQNRRKINEQEQIYEDLIGFSLQKYYKM